MVVSCSVSVFDGYVSREIFEFKWYRKRSIITNEISKKDDLNDNICNRLVTLININITLVEAKYNFFTLHTRICD